MNKSAVKLIGLIPATSSMIGIAALVCAMAAVYAIQGMIDVQDVFDASWSMFQLEPWRMVTYTLFHSSFEHIATNSIAIVAFGWIAARCYTDRAWLAVYFLGAALSAVIVVLVVPGGHLIGSSAGGYALCGLSVGACFRCQRNGYESPLYFSGWVWTAVLLILLGQGLMGPPDALLAHGLGALIGFLSAFVTEFKPLKPIA